MFVTLCRSVLQLLQSSTFSAETSNASELARANFVSDAANAWKAPLCCLRWLAVDGLIWFDIFLDLQKGMAAFYTRIHCDHLANQQRPVSPGYIKTYPMFWKRATEEWKGRRRGEWTRTWNGCNVLKWLDFWYFCKMIFWKFSPFL